MRAQSVQLEQCANHSVWEMGLDRLEDLTRFVFSVYFAHSPSDVWHLESARDFQKMLSDDRRLAPQSTVFAAVARDGSILSTGRAIERGSAALPIERDFHIRTADVERLLPPGLSLHRSFEVARLATDATAICASGIARDAIVQITDAVVRRIIDCTAREVGNLWVASMDVRALELFRKRGFDFKDLGPTHPAYLGSPTTPVALSIDACRAVFRAEARDKYDHYFGQAARHAEPVSRQAPTDGTATLAVAA